MFQALNCWIVSDFKLADLCKNEYNVGLVSIRTLRFVQKSQNHRFSDVKVTLKKSSSETAHFIDEKLNLKAVLTLYNSNCKERILRM